MLGLRSRGFDWKEIAGVLQMTDTAARAAFWREVKRARSKNGGRSLQEKSVGRGESPTNGIPDDPTVPPILRSLVEARRRNPRRQDRPVDGE